VSPAATSTMTEIVTNDFFMNSRGHGES
jgi:hypothetical protein